MAFIRATSDSIYYYSFGEVVPMMCTEGLAARSRISTRIEFYSAEIALHSVRLLGSRSYIDSSGQAEFGANPVWPEHPF
jgi:hypothetical protein